MQQCVVRVTEGMPVEFSVSTRYVVVTPATVLLTRLWHFLNAQNSVEGPQYKLKFLSFKRAVVY